MRYPWAMPKHAQQIDDWLATPLGQALLEVEISSNLISVVRQLQSMGGETRNSLDYRLAGKINVANRLRSLSFDYAGELDYLPSNKPAAPRDE